MLIRCNRAIALRRTARSRKCRDTGGQTGLLRKPHIVFKRLLPNGKTFQRDFNDIQLTAAQKMENTIQNGGQKPEVGVNNVHLSLYTRQKIYFNDYIYILGIREHDETSLNTARCQGEMIHQIWPS